MKPPENGTTGSGNPATPKTIPDSPIIACLTGPSQGVATDGEMQDIVEADRRRRRGWRCDVCGKPLTIGTAVVLFDDDAAYLAHDTEECEGDPSLLSADLRDLLGEPDRFRDRIYPALAEIPPRLGVSA